MNAQQFCYWLQGYFELTEKEDLTPEQVKVIKEHLQLTFNKVTHYDVPPVVYPYYPDKPLKLDGTGMKPQGYEVTVTCCDRKGAEDIFCAPPVAPTSFSGG